MAHTDFPPTLKLLLSNDCIISDDQTGALSTYLGRGRDIDVFYSIYRAPILCQMCSTRRNYGLGILSREGVLETQWLTLQPRGSSALLELLVLSW